MKSMIDIKNTSKLLAIICVFFLASCGTNDKQLAVAVGLETPAPPAICLRRVHHLRISEADSTAAEEAKEKQRIVDDRERLADRLAVCRRYMCELRPDLCVRKKRKKARRTS